MVWTRSEKVSKSLHTRDKGLAFAARDRANGHSPLLAIPKKDVTFAALEKLYLAWANGRLAPATIAVRLWALHSFADDTSATRVSECSPDAIQRAVQARLAAGAAPRTINAIIEGMKALVTRATRQHWYAGPNPFIGFERIPQPTRHVRWLTQLQIAALLEAAHDDSRDAVLLFSLGIYAGLRISEIIEARWEWINWNAGVINAYGPKSRRERTIPLHARLAEILCPPRATTGYLVAPDHIPGAWRYRFEPRKLFARVTKSANLTWVTPHTLRHTFASQLASAGVDIYKIARWLGHADIKTTQIYAHLKPQDNDINRF